MMRKTPKLWQEDPRAVARVRLAKWFAGLKGYTIDAGSWIHAPSGKTVAHGWESFYLKYRVAILELIWGPRPVDPDPQRDGGLPWTRADEEQMSAIADYHEGEIAGDA